MREETLYTTKIPIDNSLGIRSLATLLWIKKTESVGNKVNFYATG